MNLFLIRCKAAYYAFMFKDLNIITHGYRISPYGARGDCDYERRKCKCKNKASECVSRSFLKIEFSIDADHHHVCAIHAKEIVTEQRAQSIYLNGEGENISYIDPLYI